VRDVTDATFAEDVLQSTSPVVVDCWAPWCAPCEGVTKLLAELEDRAAGRVAFVKLDVDENPSLSGEYEILALPTVLIFESGRPTETIVGARGRAVYERALERWLG
jgi:thioredoxin 1